MQVFFFIVQAKLVRIHGIHRVLSLIKLNDASGTRVNFIRYLSAILENNTCTHLHTNQSIALKYKIVYSIKKEETINRQQ